MSMTSIGIRRIGVSVAVAGMVAAMVAGCGTKGANSVSGLGDVTGTVSPTPTAASTPTPTPTLAPSPTPTATVPTTTPPTTTPPSGPIFTLKTPFPILTFILPPATVSPDDCIHYNPAGLAINNAGAIGYQINDGSSILLLVDNASDALTAYNMARNFNQQCFIGRGNSRAGDQRYRYITEYWQGAGVSATLPTTDCVGYDNSNLTINNLGTTGYQLVSGNNALLVFDSQADANKGKAIAATHHNLCFIGRGNGRTDRNKYITKYWK